MCRTTTKPTLIKRSLLALELSLVAEETAHCKHVLQGCYLAWRKTACHLLTEIERNSQKGKAMMQATSREYQEQQKATPRKRHLKAKLLALTNKQEGASKC